MGIKVAINGYGRIGRQVLRAIYDYKLEDQLEVVAINASGSLETDFPMKAVLSIVKSGGHRMCPHRQLPHMQTFYSTIGYNLG